MHIEKSNKWNKIEINKENIILTLFGFIKVKKERIKQKFVCIALLTLQCDLENIFLCRFRFTLRLTKKKQLIKGKSDNY